MGKTIAPLRFVIFALVYLAVAYGVHRIDPVAKYSDPLVLGFDVAATVFMLSLLPYFRDRSAATMRRHAEANDANRLVILVMTALVTIVVMATIAGELKGAQQGIAIAIAKLVVTLLLVWLFLNFVFALHYAHDYYRRDPETQGDCKGIGFPETREPDFSDFVYFAFTMGMTFQTSDCEITSQRIRHVSLLHSFLSYIFSIGIIAFTINALGASG